MAIKEGFTFYNVCSDLFAPMHQGMRNSLEKFYPNAPFIKFDQKDLNSLPEPYQIGYANPYLLRIIFKTHSRAAQIDSDCIVCNTLPDIIEGSYDVAAPLNNGKFGFSTSFRYISSKNYLNIGTFVIANKAFIDDWDNLARREIQNCPFAEQDIFNMAFYSGAYKAHILDTKDSLYGCSTIGRYPEMYMKGDNIMLDDKIVRILHNAGPNKDQTKKLPEAVKKYIDYLIH